MRSIYCKIEVDISDEMGEEDDFGMLPAITSRECRGPDITVALSECLDIFPRRVLAIAALLDKSLLDVRKPLAGEDKPELAARADEVHAAELRLLEAAAEVTAAWAAWDREMGND